MEFVDGAKDYVLGHSEAEMLRLRRQAAVYAPFTDDVLRAAGLKQGMAVLDIGCGVGDVSFAAARLVGPDGRVRGVDRSAEALAAARARAERDGVTNAVFVEADIDGDVGGPYDAVIGRFILLHRKDPAATIASLVEALPRGGIMAFIEMDLSTASVTPPMPLFAQAMAWIGAAYAGGDHHVDMASMLYGSFRSAGLDPRMIGTVLVEGGPDAFAYEYVAETVRSLLPRIVETGAATAAEIGAETLAERLRDESLKGDHCFFYPRMVGAFARRP